jgi:molybdopterin molybdotransferase
VAILATGDELVPPGELPGPGKIVSSNHLGVAALAAQAGAQPRQLGIACDTRESLERHLEQAEGSHVLVTIGGASVGEHDLVVPVLRERGVVLEFWTINMRPGKPLMFGHLSAQRVLGLPGNPVSALICSRLFLVPLIRALLGLPQEDPATYPARLAEPIEANGPRQHYMRARLRKRAGGALEVAPVRSQDSSLLAPLASADALLVRPPRAPALPAGTEVSVVLIDF